MVALWQAGVRNVVAASGTALTAQQLAGLAQAGTSRVVLLFDADAAGQGAARKGVETALDAGLTPYAVSLPDGPSESPSSVLVVLTTPTVPTGQSVTTAVREVPTSVTAAPETVPPATETPATETPATQGTSNPTPTTKKPTASTSPPPPQTTQPAPTTTTAPPCNPTFFSCP